MSNRTLPLTHHSVVLVASAVTLTLLAHWAEMLLPLFGTAMSTIAVVYGWNVHPAVGVWAFVAATLLLSFALSASARLVITAVAMECLLAAYTDYAWWGFWLSLTSYRLWVGGPAMALWVIPESSILLWLKLCGLFSPQTGITPSFPSTVLWPSGPLDWSTPWINAYEMCAHPTILLLSVALLALVEKLEFATSEAIKTFVWSCTGNDAWCPEWRHAEVARRSEEIRARHLRKMPSPEVLRRQREAAQKNWEEQLRRERQERERLNCRPSIFGTCTPTSRRSRAEFEKQRRLSPLVKEHKFVTSPNKPSQQTSVIPETLGEDIPSPPPLAPVAPAQNIPKVQKSHEPDQIAISGNASSVLNHSLLPHIDHAIEPVIQDGPMVLDVGVPNESPNEPEYEAMDETSDDVEMDELTNLLNGLEITSDAENEPPRTGRPQGALNWIIGASVPAPHPARFIPDLAPSLKDHVHATGSAPAAATMGIRFPNRTVFGLVSTASFTAPAPMASTTVPTSASVHSAGVPYSGPSPAHDDTHAAPTGAPMSMTVDTEPKLDLEALPAASIPAPSPPSTGLLTYDGDIHMDIPKGVDLITNGVLRLGIPGPPNSPTDNFANSTGSPPGMFRGRRDWTEPTDLSVPTRTGTAGFTGPRPFGPWARHFPDPTIPQRPAPAPIRVPFVVPSGMPPPAPVNVFRFGEASSNQPTAAAGGVSTDGSTNFSFAVPAPLTMPRPAPKGIIFTLPGKPSNESTARGASDPVTAGAYVPPPARPNPPLLAPPPMGPPPKPTGDVFVFEGASSPNESTAYKASAPVAPYGYVPAPARATRPPPEPPMNRASDPIGDVFVFEGASPSNGSTGAARITHGAPQSDLSRPAAPVPPVAGPTGGDVFTFRGASDPDTSVESPPLVALGLYTNGMSTTTAPSTGDIFIFGGAPSSDEEETEPATELPHLNRPFTPRFDRLATPSGRRAFFPPSQPVSGIPGNFLGGGAGNFFGVTPAGVYDKYGPRKRDWGRRIAPKPPPMALPAAPPIVFPAARRATDEPALRWVPNADWKPPAAGEELKRAKAAEPVTAGAGVDPEGVEVRMETPEETPEETQDPADPSSHLPDPDPDWMEELFGPILPGMPATPYQRVPNPLQGRDDAEQHQQQQEESEDPEFSALTDDERRALDRILFGDSGDEVGVSYEVEVFYDDDDDDEGLGLGIGEEQYDEEVDDEGEEEEGEDDDEEDDEEDAEGEEDEGEEDGGEDQDAEGEDDDNASDDSFSSIEFEDVFIGGPDASVLGQQQQQQQKLQDDDDVYDEEDWDPNPRARKRRG